jgi:hypothetical protein
MNRGRLALVKSPQFDYCQDYRCAGDCGKPHNDRERKEYVAHALATFDALNAGARRERVDSVEQVRRKTKSAL